MALKDYPHSRTKELVVQELKGELLIYDLSTNKAFCLNETSALVWQLCDGKSSISEISRSISKQQKSPVTEDFVWLAIDYLREGNLLENGHAITFESDGLSRREMIRRVGLASVVALPVISSLVAPTAAMAASGSVAGSVAACGRCTTSEDCAPGAGTCNTGCCGIGSICSIGSPNGMPGDTVSFCGPRGTCASAGLQECCSGQANCVSGACVCA